jgi:hypothetical protein
MMNMKHGRRHSRERLMGQQILNAGNPDAGWIFAIAGILVTE